MSREPESILALRLGGIGEVLAITPSLRALRERFSRSRITLLAERSAGQVARGWVDEVISADAPYRASGMRSMLRPRFTIESVRLVERILRRRWDLFLDFHHLFALRHAVKPVLLSLLSRAPRRIGFGSKFFLTDRVPDPDDRHMTERNRALLEPLGIRVTDTRPSLRVDPADQEWIDSLLDAMGLSGGPLIAVAPGSSRPVTRWGADRFREAAARLAHRGTVVLVGTAGERELCATVAAGAPNLAGKTTVGRLAALIRRSALLLSNDSGPLHMAYAVGTPVVGVFRPLEYRRWGAYADPRGIRAFTREGAGAREGLTLPLITVDEVVEACEEFLDETAPRS